MYISAFNWVLSSGAETRKCTSTAWWKVESFYLFPNIEVTRSKLIIEEHVFRGVDCKKLKQIILK